MKNRLFFLPFLFIFFTSGCIEISNIKPVKEISEVPSDFLMEFSLVDETSINEDQIIFNIENNIFTPNMYIKNGQTPTMYRIFFLVDYIQTPIKYESKLMNYIDLTLEKNEKKEFSAELSEVPKGAHDLIVICIKDPESTLKTEEYIDSYTYILSRRGVLLNGENNVVKKNFVNAEVFNKSVSEDKAYKSLFITWHDKREIKDSLTKFSNSNKAHIQLIMGNPEEQNEYAIFAILDNEQIKVLNPFVQVDGKGDFKTDLLKLPLEYKNLNKNLIVGIAERPFTTDINEVIKQRVEFTNRLTITK